MDVLLPDGSRFAWPYKGYPFPQTVFWFRGTLYRVWRWQARKHRGELVDVAIADHEHPAMIPDADGQHRLSLVVETHA